MSPLIGFAALLASYLMSQFFRSFLAVLTPSLASDLSMTNNEMSQALGAWFIAFAIAQFVVGPMLDGIGPRKTAGLLHMFCAGGGAGLFAVATAPWMVMTGMGLIGVGCAPVLMATFYIFRKTYSPARLAVLTSTFIAMGSAGNLLGTSPLAAAVDVWGWRSVMWGLSAMSVMIGLAVLLLVKHDKSRTLKQSMAGSYRDVLANRHLWPIFPIMALSYAGISNIRGLWAGPYFEDVHGLGASAIGAITLWMAISMIVGTLLYGPLDTVFNSRKWVVAAGTIIMTGTLAVWALDPGMDVARVTWILVVMGLTGVSYPVLMAHAMAFVPDEMTGRGATLLNFFAIGGAGIMQSVSGFVYDWSYIQGDILSGYGTVIWLYVAISGVSLAIYLVSKDVKPNMKPNQLDIGN